MDNKTPIIRCPKCGYEYLPAEILLPQYILGQPDDIVRDESGKIKKYTGADFSLDEDFTCVCCGCNFKVEGTANFVTKEIMDMDGDYCTTLYTDRVKLEEN